MLLIGGGSHVTVWPNEMRSSLAVSSPTDPLDLGGWGWDDELPLEPVDVCLMSFPLPETVSSLQVP